LRLRLVLLSVTVAGLAGALLSAPWAPSDASAPAVLTAVAALGALILLEARRALLPVRVIGGCGVALAVLAVVRPPHWSADLWSYAMYGRIVSAHHHNPYFVRPSAFPGDRVLARVTPGWRNSRSVYGPAFTAVSAMFTAAAGRSLLATRVLFQGLAAGAGAAALVVIGRLRPASWVYLAVACNPILVLWTYNGGHNDAVVGLCLVLAAVAAARDRPVLAGLAMAVAIQVKVIAALGSCALALWTFRRRGWRATVTQLGVHLGPLAVGYAIVGGTAAVRPLFGLAGQMSRATVWELLRSVVPQVTVRHTGVAVLALTLLLGGAVLLRSHRDATPSLAIAGMVLAYLLAGAYVLPWYGAWVLPLLCLVPDRRVQLLGVVQSLLVTCAYAYHHESHADALDRLLRLSVAGAQFTTAALCLIMVVFAFARKSDPTDQVICQITT
jgi:hypothetical protein